MATPRYHLALSTPFKELYLAQILIATMYSTLYYIFFLVLVIEVLLLS